MGFSFATGSGGSFFVAVPDSGAGDASGLGRAGRTFGFGFSLDWGSSNFLISPSTPGGGGLSEKMMSLGSITIATLLLLAVVAVIVFRRGKDAKPAG